MSVWHRCPHPGPSSTTCRYLAKNEVEKKAITLIIIGRFYPKSNLTIFYDYIPGYKIWLQYTNQSFLKKYQKENIFWKWKRAITPLKMGWFYPNWNLTSILWLYTCELNLNSIHWCFQKISNWNFFQCWKRAVTPNIIGGFYPKSNLTYIL